VNQYTATANPSESFAYDADGNLASDGTWTLEWDAENRLIEIRETYSDLPHHVRLVFEYDYMGRRVRKQVFSYDLKTTDWKTTPDLDQRFVYDGWNGVLVLDGAASNATGRKYTWGLDLSGQRGNGRRGGIHGAGGIGGLLAAKVISGTYQGSYWFLYDTNGNIAQAVQSTSGLPLVAHYEYDPYGKVIGVPTGFAATHPFRFSTKWFDNETGLGYWGIRYYSPRLGRWLSHDPLWELGWLNAVALPSIDLLTGGRIELNSDITAVTARKVLEQLIRQDPIDGLTSLSLYNYTGNDPIGVTDPLGGCEENPQPPPLPPPGIPGPGGPAGTVGAAAECAPDIARADICRRWRSMVLDEFDGSLDACDADPNCRALRRACETAGANR